MNLICERVCYREQLKANQFVSCGGIGSPLPSGNLMDGSLELKSNEKEKGMPQ